MLKLCVMVAAVVLALHPVKGFASDVSPARVLMAAVVSDDPHTTRKAGELLSVFRTIGQIRETVVSNEPWVAAKPNFVFASGDDFIVQGRLAVDALTEFDPKVAEFILELPANSGHCFVQSFSVGLEKRWVLLVVHSVDNEAPEYMSQCLTAGLYKFVKGSLDDFVPSKWREAYVGLLSESQSTFSSVGVN
ncbi:hypothetical protein [uncultured Shimia sp.]|uniref:hypothetical protein n=1 Tax=uncultured Shimia sp. TaxID=573152 RepID=UPI002637BFB5|nr:hypothetical protein [uncultured Shimia sp.]